MVNRKTVTIYKETNCSRSNAFTYHYKGMISIIIIALLLSFTHSRSIVITDFDQLLSEQRQLNEYAKRDTQIIPKAKNDETMPQSENDEDSKTPITNSVYDQARQREWVQIEAFLRSGDGLITGTLETKNGDADSPLDSAAAPPPPADVNEDLQLENNLNAQQTDAKSHSSNPPRPGGDQQGIQPGGANQQEKQPGGTDSASGSDAKSGKKKQTGKNKGGTAGEGSSDESAQESQDGDADVFGSAPSDAAGAPSRKCKNQQGEGLLGEPCPEEKANLTKGSQDSESSSAISEKSLTEEWNYVLMGSILALFLLAVILLKWVREVLSSLLDECFLIALRGIMVEVSLVLAVNTLIIILYYDNRVPRTFYPLCVTINIFAVCWASIAVCIAFALQRRAHTYEAWERLWPQRHQKKQREQELFDELLADEQGEGGAAIAQSAESAQELKELKQILQYFLIKQDFILPVTHLPSPEPVILRENFNFAAYLSRCAAKELSKLFRLSPAVLLIVVLLLALAHSVFVLWALNLAALFLLCAILYSLHNIEQKLHHQAQNPREVHFYLYEREVWDSLQERVHFPPYLSEPVQEANGDAVSEEQPTKPRLPIRSKQYRLFFLSAPYLYCKAAHLVLVLQVLLLFLRYETAQQEPSPQQTQTLDEHQILHWASFTLNALNSNCKPIYTATRCSKQDSNHTLHSNDERL